MTLNCEGQVKSSYIDDVVKLLKALSNFFSKYNFSVKLYTVVVMKYLGLSIIILQNYIHYVLLYLMGNQGIFKDSFD